MSVASEVSRWQVLSLYHGIALYVKSNGTMIAARGYTSTNMRRAAEMITGKAYKRGENGLRAAYADLGKILDKPTEI